MKLISTIEIVAVACFFMLPSFIICAEGVVTNSEKEEASSLLGVACFRYNLQKAGCDEKQIERAMPGFIAAQKERTQICDSVLEGIAGLGTIACIEGATVRCCTPFCCKCVLPALVLAAVPVVVAREIVAAPTQQDMSNARYAIGLDKTE